MNKKRSKRSRIIINSDGEALISRFQKCPMGAEGLIDEVFTPLQGSHVDTIFFCLGSDVDGIRASNQWSHKTQFGEIFADHLDEFPSEQWKRRALNVRDFFANAADPPEIVINHAHRIGMEAFVSIRMNDCHEGITGEYYVGEIKRQRPEWTLGERAPIPMFRYAFDFMHEGPRKYRLDMIEEASRQYDLDGFELDFLRHPIYFAAPDMERGFNIMTQFVRDVRGILDEAGKARGKYLGLSVRVPPSFAQSKNIGLDCRTWIEEGLIDIIVPGTMAGGAFRIPVEEFIAAVRGTDVQVHANIGISAEASIRRGFPYYTDEMFRAQAAVYWQLGVDGIYSWNANCIRYFINKDWDWSPFREIGEPTQIARKNKHYLLDRLIDPSTGTYGSFAETVMPPVQLPAALPGDDSAALMIDLADDISFARKDGIVVAARLHVEFDSTETAASATLRWNRAELFPQREDLWLIADLADHGIRLGQNRLEIYSSQPGKVEAVEVTVDYGQ